MDNADLQILIDYSTDKVVEEFCRVNQFYSFSTESKAELRGINAEMIKDKSGSTGRNNIICTAISQKKLFISEEFGD